MMRHKTSLYDYHNYYKAYFKSTSILHRLHKASFCCNLYHYKIMINISQVNSKMWLLSRHRLLTSLAASLPLAATAQPRLCYAAVQKPSHKGY